METRGEELDLIAPLPDCFRAESMEEKEAGLGVGLGFGPPEVDGCVIGDSEGLGGEAGAGVAAAEVFGVEGDEADEGGRH